MLHQQQDLNQAKSVRLKNYQSLCKSSRLLRLNRSVVQGAPDLSTRLPKFFESSKNSSRPCKCTEQCKERIFRWLCQDDKVLL